MKGCRPLSKQEIAILKPLFSGKMAKRNVALFLLGANTGFRVSGLLSLTLGDVLTDAGTFSDTVTLARRNTKGKKAGHTVKLNSHAKKALEPWLEELKKAGVVHRRDFIFRSRIGDNCPISRVQAWRVLTAVYKAAKLSGKIGTHGMRKTFANNVYDFFLEQNAKGVPVDAFRATSKALGHMDIKSTDQYLSFRTETLSQAIEEVGV